MEITRLSGTKAEQILLLQRLGFRKTDAVKTAEAIEEELHNRQKRGRNKICAK